MLSLSDIFLSQDQYSTNQTVSPIKNQLMKRHIEGSKDQEGKYTFDIF